jgi:hypothetical protein
MYILDFDHRSDGGPCLIGPFGTTAAAERWVGKQGLDLGCTRYEVKPLHVPDLPI